MRPELVDHVIVLAIVAIQPIVGYRGTRRFLAAVRRDPDARRREYRGMIVLEWSVAAFVLAAWFMLGRDRAALGLDVPLGIPSLIGLAVTAAGLAFLHSQTVAMRRGGEAAIAALRPQVEPIADMLPHTVSEARWFRAVAVTAGICEELVYRGFLIAYVGTFLGPWPAVAVAALLFAAAHIHQGRANLLKSGVVGLLTGALYVGSGSLLWPIIVHAALDLQAGAFAWRVLGSQASKT